MNEPAEPNNAQDIIDRLDSVGPDRYTEWRLIDLMRERAIADARQLVWKSLGIDGSGKGIMDACCRRCQAKIRAIDVVLRMRGYDSVEDVVLMILMAKALRKGNDDE